MNDPASPAFRQMALHEALFQVLEEVGYETPSPIQAETIPLLLEGRDVLGQAQTGTGKTAAFALPLLTRLDLARQEPQVLVLTPTRELAIQVAEAFQKYASRLEGFHVLPVYGGQEFGAQIRALRRGVHVIVGTPGRVMDHMRRGTLKLEGLAALVLDEADEMLRMGFIDDVEWILEQTPPNRQTALFSATMPEAIRRISSRYLKDPAEVTIKVRTTTAETIKQRYWPVSGMHKLDALTRILEAEPFDAMIVFVRTKTTTVELAEKLAARGYAAAPLNGDIVQNLRERTVDNLKKGKLDILVATDVAARGLDVERISHVVNYDIPHDTEAYVHRIGRTGRAGREGQAILFVAPREKRMLGAIEKATRQKIELMELPSAELVNDRRVARFKQRITDALEAEDLRLYIGLVEQYQEEQGVDPVSIAAALARLLQGDKPFLLQPKAPAKAAQGAGDKPPGGKRAGKAGADEPARARSMDGAPARKPRTSEAEALQAPLEEGMERFRLDVGHEHQVKPANIVGAIANEAGLESRHIGRIVIFDDYSLVDLPEGMPRDIFRILKKTWVAGRPLRIARVGPDAEAARKGSGERKAPARKPRDQKAPAMREKPRKSGKKSS